MTMEYRFKLTFVMPDGFKVRAIKTFQRRTKKAALADARKWKENCHYICGTENGIVNYEKAYLRLVKNKSCKKKNKV